MDIEWGNQRAPNIFANFTQGYQVGRAIKKNRQADRADKVFASGDDAAAERAYIEAGDVQSANAIHSRRLEDRREQVRQDAVGKMAGGDASGAAQAAAAAGDQQLFEQITKLDDAKRARLKEHSQVIGAALHSLRGPDGQPLPDAAQRWANMRAHFEADGYSPEELNLDVTQPGVIDGGISEAMTVYQAVQAAEQARHNREMEGRPVAVGDGADLIDPRTGRKLYSNEKNFSPKGGGRGGGSYGATPHGPVIDIDPNQVKWK